MYLQSRKAQVLGTCLCSLACGMSVWICVQVQRLALPFPFPLPILNIGISLAGLAVIWSSRPVISFIQGRQSTGRLTGSLYGLTLLPFALIVLSATYIFPSDLRACRTELQWLHLFRSKDEAVIRSIQNQLHCCGFNSMRDRAWPFPSRNIDARTCERTSGFQTSCGHLLKDQVLTVAIVNGLTCALSMILLYIIASAISVLSRPGYTHGSNEAPNVQTRLLYGESNATHDVQETLEEEERRRGQQEFV